MDVIREDLPHGYNHVFSHSTAEPICLYGDFMSSRRKRWDLVSSIGIGFLRLADARGRVGHDDRGPRNNCSLWVVDGSSQGGGGIIHLSPGRLQPNVPNEE